MTLGAATDVCILLVLMVQIRKLIDEVRRGSGDVRDVMGLMEAAGHDGDTSPTGLARSPAEPGSSPPLALTVAVAGGFFLYAGLLLYASHAYAVPFMSYVLALGVGVSYAGVLYFLVEALWS